MEKKIKEITVCMSGEEKKGGGKKEGGREGRKEKEKHAPRRGLLP